MTLHELSPLDVAIASALILINGAISIVLKLGLEKRLALAATRCIVQLALIGYVLEWIFRLERWDVILLLCLVMTVVAGISAVGRVERKLPGLYLNSIVSIFVSSWLVTVVTLLAILGYYSWRETPAQYVIPFLGVILGNTLNGVSLGMDRLGEHLTRRRGEVELLLSLGATRWEAARGPVRDSIRTGMIPMINSMMVVGIVSLPGIMTGQLLSGVAPAAAVRYQIVIMFIIAAGTALGTIGVILLSFERLFNHSHQFLHDEIGEKRK